ncbi:Na+/H+ antiporter NhaA [Nocardioides sp. zg-DK7169]|uniref:Na+/H+ antiporter NhaA n=1 Tax=Nocardioides sp. zg-DK7169 TaxID=2736600 RepID=UPI00155623B9|nr:Na+/H+ antiporter NhaA [Nocardioides sp. zg-DK7169]NPC98242.1 Na+/H+ antiporter NhaA [Nocardioides sp. zg-DK7169]
MPDPRSSAPAPGPSDQRRVLTRPSWPEYQRITEILRMETVGGMLLIAGAVLAVVWANLPGDSYASLRDLHVGGQVLGFDLDLSLAHWAADGLLAVFFFLVGLELKKEFVAGDLRRLDRAIVPVAAAIGGVAVPALLYVLVNLGSGGETLHGWAIPTATDIAFAVAVLAVVGSRLPSALRLFLLTLAVVDDLVAISIIALFYTDELHVEQLLWALVPLALFGLLVQRWPAFFGTRGWASWLVLVPLGALVWAFFLESGVHATIAGVVLGFLVPVMRKSGGEGPGLAEVLEHRVRPLSAGFCVPVFAFFSAGVALGDGGGLGSLLSDGVAWGIVIGLVVGKPIGILAATWLVTRTRRANLDSDITWRDLTGMSMLAGIGFTVSLLISELSFDAGSAHYDHAKIAILGASVLAAGLSALVLVPRNRHYRELELREQVDEDRDGIPDVFQRPEDQRG